MASMGFWDWTSIKGLSYFSFLRWWQIFVLQMISSFYPLLNPSSNLSCSVCRSWWGLGVRFLLLSSRPWKVLGCSCQDEHHKQKHVFSLNALLELFPAEKRMAVLLHFRCSDVIESASNAFPDKWNRLIARQNITPRIDLNFSRNPPSLKFGS